MQGKGVVETIRCMRMCSLSDDPTTKSDLPNDAGRKNYHLKNYSLLKPFDDTRVLLAPRIGSTSKFFNVPGHRSQSRNIHICGQWKLEYHNSQSSSVIDGAIPLWAW